MYIRINGEYLEFSESIYVEKRAKLFENASKAAGDFSYSFDLIRSQKNMRLLGVPIPDSASKQVYTAVQCDLVNSAGESIYSGSIRVDVAMFARIRVRPARY